VESIAFYAQWKSSIESSRSCMEHASGASYFLHVVMRVLKVIKEERYVNWEPLTFCTW
jgi:hypothetical protein